MNKVQIQDYQYFADSFPLGQDLAGSSFLITGATGLIGSSIVHCLLSLKNGISITAPVRNKDKAEDRLGRNNNLAIVECDLLRFILTSNSHYDYIIHCASPTSGRIMSKEPVETFNFIVESTRLLLEYARHSNIKGMVFVSSIESYGQISDERIITEDIQGYIDMSSPRSSYPLGKRSAEFLCSMYAKEFAVDVKSVRLTQTLGAGVSLTDDRVFSQFAKSVVCGNDIVLHTTGESSKPYCYTIDAVTAILHVLINGVAGEIYNVANEDTFISIHQLADFLCNSFNSSANVVIDLHPEFCYAPKTVLKLSTEKVKALGWHPHYNLRQMFERMIESFVEDGNKIE